jgi:phospho-N-acetylmuramoyl-pentapeptide-transferase
MGGVIVIAATLLAYVAGHFVFATLPSRQLGTATGLTTTAVVLLGLLVGQGLVGFIADYFGTRGRVSPGRNKRRKVLGQVVVATVFGLIALGFPGSAARGQTVAAHTVSFVKDIPWLDVTTYGALALFVFVVVAMTNAVKLTDGLDGLATGSAVLVLGSYFFIAFWEYRHWAADPNYGGAYSYVVRDPLEIALIAVGAAAACAGFLYWNTKPAQILLGNTGALALGGLVAGLAFATRTVLLLPILALLFTLIAVTWTIQVSGYQLVQRRVFRMVPLQHHFELAGWTDMNIVIRFWIIAGVGVAAGLGVYYSDFLRVVDLHR